MNVEILDLLFEITEWAAAWAGQSLGRRDEDNPAPYLAWIIAHVRAGIHDTANLRNLEDGCEDFITRAHRALGLVEDGQLLRAVCPWCRGITPSHPEGGQRTWRVRAKLPDGKRSIVKVDPKDVLWLVVCESGTCNPPTKDVGTWHRDRPAWMLRSEGDFLAKRLLDIGTIVGEQDLAS